MARGFVTLALTLMATLCFSGAAAASELAKLLKPITRLWSDAPENMLPYEVELILPDGEDELEDMLRNASSLVAQSDDGAAGADNLIAMARETPTELNAALYTKGYYSGQITVAIAGQPIDDRTAQIAFPEQRPVPVKIRVEPGPLFRFGNITIAYRGHAPPKDEEEEALREVGLIRGAPALSRAVLRAGQQLVQYWRQRGYAFARVVSRDVVADHAVERLDVAFIVATGEPAQFGRVTIKSEMHFDPELIRNRANIETGEPYSPEVLKQARKRLTWLEGLQGVRIIEGEEPDADGRVPITIDVTERKPNYFGFNAAMSSVDGAELNVYWGNRNLWGGGEHLRLDGTVSNWGGDAVDETEYEARATLTWPSIMSPYTNYKALLFYKHEEPEDYESDEARISYGITHRFREHLIGELAATASWIATEDALGDYEFVLLSLPGELVYDTRDTPLDASSGLRASLSAAPAADIRNQSAFLHSRAALSNYWRIGSEPHVVAASRIGAGMIIGGSLEDVPATERFLAGGGGSVRGHAYRSVGPEIGDEAIGGLSIAEATGELRIRATDEIGVVPFVDAAFVTTDSLFAGDSVTAVGAGIGLRYHTVIGPIRLDLAVPVDQLDDRGEVVFYVGLGQAF